MREVAPPALRQRVAALMAGVPATVSLSWWQQRSTWYSAAAAACLLLGLGAAMRMGDFNSNGDAVASAAIIPTQVQKDLLYRHDWCDAKFAEHHLIDVPRNDMGQIRQAMEASINQPVWAADLGQEGWRFRGAKVCPVGDHKSAHLMFQKSDAVASIFSLPAGESPGAGGTCASKAKEGKCCFELEGHLVSGFVHEGKLYCIVVRSPKKTVSIADVRSLRDRHRGEIVAMADEAERVMLAGK